MVEGVTEEAGRRSDFRGSSVLAALAVAAVAWLLAQLLLFPYGRDQAESHVVAAAIARGGAPYRDAWNVRPPGIYFAFTAARLFGTDPMAVRLLEALLWGTLPLAYAGLTRRRLGAWAPGLVGGALACFLHVRSGFWNTAQPESFAAVAIAWALFLASPRPGTKERAAPWIGIGALYAAAFLMKPHLAGGAAVTLAIGLRREVPLSGRRGAARRVALPLIAGASVPIGLMLAFFAMRHALGDLYETLFVFAPRYSGLTLSTAAIPAAFLRAAWEWIQLCLPIPAAGLVLAFALPAQAPHEREVEGHALGVALACVAGIALQAKFYPYHYDAALAVAALPAGLGLYKVWVAAGRGAARAVALTVLTGLIVAADDQSFFREAGVRRRALGLPLAERRAVLDALDRRGDFAPDRNREAAEWLAAHSSADERVLVLGWQPTVYLMAGRRPASRYFHDMAPRAAWGARERSVLMDDLRRTPPAAVAVARGDRFPWATGDLRSSEEFVAAFPELRGFLADACVPGGANDGFVFYDCRTSR